MIINNIELKNQKTGNLVSNSIETVSQYISIFSSADWNNFTLSTKNALRDAFSAAENLENQISLVSGQHSDRIKSTLSYLENINEILASSIKVNPLRLKSNFQITPETIFSIETSPEWFEIYAPMHLSAASKEFELQEFGSFSSIRSKGTGFLKVDIEKVRAPLIEHSSIKNLIDGSENTAWIAEEVSEHPIAPLTLSPEWAYGETEGAMALLTIRPERAFIASELKIVPVSKFPLYVKAISWTPISSNNVFTNPTLGSSGSGWILDGDYSFSTEEDTYKCVLTGTHIGFNEVNPAYISQTLNLASAASSTLSSVYSSDVSGYIDTSRVQVSLMLKGTGGEVEVRWKWLDNSGQTIDVQKETIYTNSDWEHVGTAAYAPAGAASANISIGIFSGEETHTAEVWQPRVYVGECKYNINTYISKSTRIQLPISVTSARFSILICQKNGERKINLDSEDSFVFFDEDIEPGLINSIMDGGLNKKEFISYPLSIAEIDLSYREFMPRGLLVSKPINPKGEIRRLTVNCSYRGNLNGTTFRVYPFKDDRSRSVLISPNLFSYTERAQSSYYSLGEECYFVSTEEHSANYYNFSGNYKKIIIDPKTYSKTFDGTDIDGTLDLPNPLYISRVKINALTDWLQTYGIESQKYDPNASVVWGLSNAASSYDAFKSSVNNTPDATILESDLVSTPGYQPLKITVKTKSFTAYPDGTGKPESSIIKTVSGEILLRSDVEEHQRNVEENVQSFEQWAESNTFFDLYNKKYITHDEYISLYIDDLTHTTSIWYTIERSTLRGPELKEKANKIYNKLVSNGLVDKVSSEVSATIIRTIKNNVYKTKHTPIVEGESGLLIKIYSYDLNTEVLTALGRTDYIIDKKTGMVTITNSNLLTDDTIIKADYAYLSESFIKKTVGNNNFQDKLVTGNTQYVTRNMTDYVNGENYKLKKFEPNQTKTDFYPVIEYYTTPEGKIVFSRDFFKFGDVPGEIKVEWESLDINPRVAVFTIRPSHTQTPFIKSIGIGYTTVGEIQ